MTISITTIPRDILQYFDKYLLSQPVPKLRDDSETFYRMYLYIREKLMPKLSKCPGKKKLCEELEIYFLGLYERTEIKEKKQKKYIENITQRPFYHVKSPSGRNGKIYERLRQKRALIYSDNQISVI